jgi:sec-independent protein translocase protein TatA
MNLLFLNLGGGEVTVIVLVILLFFGSKKIPELARGLGKGIREFKDATNNIQREIEESAKPIKEEVEGVKKHSGNL